MALGLEMPPVSLPLQAFPLFIVRFPMLQSGSPHFFEPGLKQSTCRPRMLSNHRQIVLSDYMVCLNLWGF